jgi:hypothetical protein
MLIDEESSVNGDITHLYLLEHSASWSICSSHSKVWPSISRKHSGTAHGGHFHREDSGREEFLDERGLFGGTEDSPTPH